jgi:hypothetical protein
MLFLNFSVDLNGTTGDMVDFQSTGDAGNGATITEMGNPVPEPSYEEGKFGLQTCLIGILPSVCS